jgi:hypothetical protein
MVVVGQVKRFKERQALGNPGPWFKKNREEKR